MKSSHILFAAAAFALVPTFADAAPRDPPVLDRSGSNQTVFCQGTYALCIKAPCSAIPTLDRLGSYVIERALCSCEVVKGISMGPGQCADREPVTQHDRTYLISTYSNRFNDQQKTLTCRDEKTLWAWCYGAPCVVDENHPDKAVCNCPVQQSAASTLGGNCELGSCKGIWSAAVPKGDQFANVHFYEYVSKNHPNMPVNKPAVACFKK